MKYFITGGTGFIGKHLIERLIKRGGTVYMLVRPGSHAKYEALRLQLGVDPDQLIPVEGDITSPELVTDAAARAELTKTIDHVYHLAAVYDMNMDDETGNKVNNEGTRNVVNFVNDCPNASLQHVSSVAVAGGDFKGKFMEAMFAEGQKLGHPYYRTKYESEGIVRDECTRPYRIYRPGMVVGSSIDGVMDKIDGPYYLFHLIKKMRGVLPAWFPLVSLEGGQLPLAPVNYITDAMEHISHKDGLDGQAFHLIQSPAPTAGEMMNTFAKAAHAPELSMRIDHKPFTSMLPMDTIGMVNKLPVVNKAKQEVAKNLGVPLGALTYITNRSVFDDRNTQAALDGSGISCPRLEDYAWKLWDYWERTLDPSLNKRKTLATQVNGKTVVVTGGSSGIGLAVAHQMAEAGAKVVLVARTLETLEEARDEINAKVPGSTSVYSCDLTDMAAIESTMQSILAEQGPVDVLVNNAGRSIRRAVVESYDRFHDYERTMQLNYFGAIKAIMTVLPTMTERKVGQIINISSIGCLTNVPRFSAYVASKSALDAFSRVLSAEVKAQNIDITTIYMPLVKTPMIAPTTMYQYVPTLSPEEAADLVAHAVVNKPKKIATRLGQTMDISYAVWPKVNDFILNVGFKMFPSSAAAKGEKGEAKEQKAPSPQSVAFSHLMKGIHW